MKKRRNTGRSWYACTLNDGIIATGVSRCEVLEKIGRHSAKFIGNSRYEIFEENETSRWKVWILGTEELMKDNGFSVSDKRNTFYYDRLFESNNSPVIRHIYNRISDYRVE